ncbi:MAG: hypothetical protein R6V54_03260 [Desulfobacteraceae bacterium]
MENIAYTIDGYMQEKLLLYDELVSVMKQEKVFIVDMDTDSLWSASSKKKRIAGKIEKLRNAMLFFLDENGVEHGMNVKNFSLAAFIRCLPLSSQLKSGLGKTRLAINLKKDEIQLIGNENQKYVREYLGVIDGIMSNFAAPARQECYSYSGAMGEPGKANALISAEV